MSLSKPLRDRAEEIVAEAERALEALAFDLPPADAALIGELIDRVSTVRCDWREDHCPLDATEKP